MVESQQSTAKLRFEGLFDLARFTRTSPAIVLKRWETNIIFNGNPRIGLLLQVRPDDSPPFEAEVKTVVDRAHLVHLQPGAILSVAYSPGAPSRVIIAALPALTLNDAPHKPCSAPSEVDET
jgi:hypothetical protein